MTPEQFCYWLRGVTELNPMLTPDTEEWDMIMDHLTTVFKKVTPAYPGASEKQEDSLKDEETLITAWAQALNGLPIEDFLHRPPPGGYKKTRKEVLDEMRKEFPDVFRKNPNFIC